MTEPCPLKEFKARKLRGAKSCPKLIQKRFYSKNIRKLADR
jgi:hypothetical protein